MRTPAGKDCKYFYGNYFRGRRDEECRLLQASGERWTKDLCGTCPVPEVLLANACEFLELHGRVTHSPASFFRGRVRVSTFCSKVKRPVTEPHVGCGECHPLPPEFVVKA